MLEMFQHFALKALNPNDNYLVILQVCTILKIKLERNFLNQLSLPGVVRKKYVSSRAIIIHYSCE